ncbi:MAG: spermidine/putrescine ABC transporter substrate-binding protein [Verrucomicrobiales bacterium]|nr:spermidine/putrescine ABC transporter substrate-binding protein [Verrucomicrobiales bacterium]
MNDQPHARRRFLAGLAAGAASAALAGCSAPKKQLLLYIYREYIDPRAVAEFEKIHDCRVVFDYFEDVSLMVAKLAAGGASAYDVVVPGHYTLPGLVRQNLLAPIRRESIPNLRHVDPAFLNLDFDPANTYSVPYLWGTTGLYRRGSPGSPDDDTWGLIFDAKKQPGPFLLLEDSRLCIAAALHYLGFRANTIDPAQLTRAKALMVDAKQRSLGFATSYAAKNRVLSGEVALAVVYNTDGMQGARQEPATRFFVPKEGGGLWLDTWSITARAPHRDLAEAFIDHTLDPRVAAGIANFTRTATANLAALADVVPTDRQDPGIYPPPEVRRRLEYCRHLGADERIYDQLWADIKAA